MRSSFGLWGAAFAGSFTNNFGEQLSVAAFGSSFQTASGNNFGVLGSFFGTRLSVATLKSSFGEQLCGFAVLTNSCLEERQLWGVALESNLWETAFGNNFSSLGGQLFGAAVIN